MIIVVVLLADLALATFAFVGWQFGHWGLACIAVTLATLLTMHVPQEIAELRRQRRARRNAIPLVDDREAVR